MRLPAVALLALVLAGAAAGCVETDLAAWWRDEGGVRVMLAPVGPDASDVEQFRNLTLTVWSVALGIAATDARSGREYIEAREFYFDPPLRVAFVENATKGAEIPLLETTSTDLRAVRIVVVRVSVNESMLATGRPIDGCFQGVEHDPPCVRVARNGMYNINDPPFSPRAGRTSVFTVPMGVHFNQANGEYYLRAEVGRLRTE